MKKLSLILITCLLCSQFSCSKDPSSDQLQYRFPEKIGVDGINRTYLVRLPRGYYDSASALPLVIGLHGTGGSADQFEKAYGFNEKSDAEGFIMVYADGIEKMDGRGFMKMRTWNAGSCCDYAMYSNINDVKFIGLVIDSVSNRYRVDRRRVYITGMSNGAMMAYRLASELPDKIAAIGVVSGPMVSSKDLALQGVVPVLHIHAAPDTKVPFSGGVGIGNYNFPPAMDGLNYWIQRDHCSATPVVEQGQGYERRSWSNSQGTVIVQCYLTNDGGHAWPGAKKQGRFGDTPSTALNATDIVWDFLRRFSLQ